MRDFKDIIIVLKRYISEDTKVYDKDVAELLHISQSYFATIKRRNSIPYAEILKFCQREKLNCCDIFFN